MRKRTKPAGKIRKVRATRWSTDEWQLVRVKAKELGLTPSQYVRARTLGTPFTLIKWRGENHARSKKAA